MSRPIYDESTYTPTRNVGRSMLDLTNEMQAAIDHETTRLGITGAQWVVLMRIASGIGASAAELCRDMGYDSGSMTRMLDRLEKRGLIARHRKVEDRRVIELSLTEAGQALYPHLRPVALTILNRFLTGFSAAEVETLMGFIDRMIANGRSAS